MAIYKCKMCGGNLKIESGSTVCKCEYCQTQQTIPRLNSDRKINLYDRANHYRQNLEFDKAAEIYEQILDEDTTDSEVYWSLILCRYGIEYVEEPVTKKRVPTVNRTQLMSIFTDDDYKKAIQYCTPEQKIIYEEEAANIDRIQREIISISSKEKPFDVFICYKETDEKKNRTQDSVIANDIYYQLVQEGFKVFFSRITLEDKIGKEYEPYIFSALNSAKVMLVIGTRREYFDAPWVKNEWMRFLSIVRKSNGEKILIPAYKDMDPYDLPEEFAYLQAQDMGKIGFIQDLIRGIKKIIRPNNEQMSPDMAYGKTYAGGNGGINVLLKRGQIALEDKEWDKAEHFFEEALYQDAECAEAYLGEFLASKHLTSLHELKECYLKQDMDGEIVVACSEDAKRIENAISKYAIDNYISADEIRRKFAFERSFTSMVSAYKKSNEKIRSELNTNRLFLRAKQYADGATKKELDEIYEDVLNSLDERVNKEIQNDQITINDIYNNYQSHLNTAEEAIKEWNLSTQHIIEERYQNVLAQMRNAKNASDYENVGSLFRELHEYKDSKAKADECLKLSKKCTRLKKIRGKLKWYLPIGIVLVFFIVLVNIINMTGEKSKQLKIGTKSSNIEDDYVNSENPISNASENYYGYGQTVDWNRSGRYQNYVVQGDWLYYSTGRKIYKMPIGGNSADIQILYDSKNTDDEKNEPLRIGVVKEWVYFSRPYDGLYKIHTDGTGLTQLVDKDIIVTDAYVNDFGRGKFNYYDIGCCSAAFHVIGDEIYFISIEKLKNDKTRQILSCLDINTNEMRFVTDSISDAHLLAGIENVLIFSYLPIMSHSVEAFHENSIFTLDIKTMRGSMITGGFNSMPKLFNKELNFVVDVVANNSENYTHRTKKLNFAIHHDFYMQEETLPLNQMEENSSNLIWDLRNKRAYKTIDGKLCYQDYSSEDDQTWKTIINADAKLIIAGFDEYVYFDTFSPGSWIPTYRVRIDGEGLEEVSWMFP